MSDVKWTRIAKTDLEDIAWFVGIQDRRPQVADELIDAIVAKVERYSRQPLMGSLHPQLPADLRVCLHKRYVVIYEPKPDGIVVLRVVDSARDLSRFGFVRPNLTEDSE